MKAFLGLVLGLAAGCEAVDVCDIDWTMPVMPGPGAADAGGADSDDPCAPHMETVLPAVGLGDVRVTCDSCGNTCDELGDPCDSYGLPCVFQGNPGVCISCCERGVGDLRCRGL